MLWADQTLMEAWGLMAVWIIKEVWSLKEMWIIKEIWIFKEVWGLKEIWHFKEIRRLMAARIAKCPAMRPKRQERSPEMHRLPCLLNSLAMSPE